MLIRTLDLLRCPFCGGRLSIVENDALDRGRDRIESGVLGCACCAFPVVAGIPVLIADEATRAAMHTLEAGRGEEAAHRLLGLEGRRRDALRARLAGNAPPTYRELLPLLCANAEADYMLHRFSDPTCLVGEALLDAVGQQRPPEAPAPRAARAVGSTPGPPAALPANAAPPTGAATGERALDICGGSGHFTRVLSRQPGTAATVLADVQFWKLWLAARIVVPQCEAVCCDANAPLPFADGLFDTVLLSDAFPYIWHKRLLAGEMRRLRTRGGAIVMPHLHSAHGENHSAGDTLSPAAYRDLFEPLEPRLFDDRRLLDGLLDERVLDLAGDVPPAGCGDTPSITLVAADDDALYRRHAVRDRLEVTGALVVNPLYRVDYADGVSRLVLTFPTPEYEDEFGLARRYLPAAVDVAADLRGPTAPAAVGPRYAELRRRRVLIDAPPLYC